MDDHPAYVIEVAELFPPQGLWTEADYLRLPHGSRVIELTAGRLIVQPRPTPDHQRIAGELAFALDSFVNERHLGEALFAPLAVRLWPNEVRMPDVIMLRAGRDALKRRLWIDGPPDWIAEVIAPGTRGADEGEKLEAYARAGVPECWLVDPEQVSVRVFTLPGGADRYELAGRYGSGTEARSVLLPGFAMALDGWL